MKPKISSICVHAAKDESDRGYPFVSIRRGENKLENWRFYINIKSESMGRILLAMFVLAFPLEES